MKPEILRNLLGPPVAFNPCLVPLTGSVNAALMASQAIYWATRTENPDAWFWKTREQWTRETYLSRYEQEGARKQLNATGFWRERYDRHNHRQFYRLDMEALADALFRHFGESGNPAFAKAENPPSLGGNSPVVVLTKTTQRLLDPPTPLPEKPGNSKNAALDTPREEAKSSMIPLEAIPPTNGNDPWKAVKTELQKTLNPRSWESWIRPTRLAYTLDGKVFVAVPSGEFADWIRENFMPAIAAAKQALGLEFSGIEFVEGARGGLKCAPGGRFSPSG